MQFEYDSSKSEANRKKHGISFKDAQGLWVDDHRIEIPARVTDEPRWLVIGRLVGKVWAAVVTYREDSVRIISVRRARVKEMALYES